MESAIVALTALTFLILYNAVSMRLRDRTDVGGQIADLSRGTADLARQVAEFGRRLALVEGRVVSANSANQDRVQSVAGEIAELGVLVQQLAVSVASHDDMLSSGVPAPAPVNDPPDHRQTQLPFVAEAAQESAAPVAEPAAAATPPAADAAAGRSSAQILAAVKNAIEANRIDIYLQPMVTLPQRKVRFYEAVTRLRDDKRPDPHRRRFHRHRGGRRPDGAHRPHGDAAMRAGAAPADGAQQGGRDILQRCGCDLEQSRHLRAVPGFPRSQPRAGGILRARIQAEHVPQSWARSKPSISLHWRSAATASPSTTSPILRIEPRELADRGVRFIKVPASLLLDQRQTSASDIHPSDLSDLLGRFGIDLVAERIEGERAVVDLLDYDVRYGQGFLFAAPRPLRPETASATGGAPDTTQVPNAAARPAPEALKADPPRLSGNAALARRAIGPG